MHYNVFYAQRKPRLLLPLSCSIAHALVTESVADSVDSSGLTYKHKMSFQKIITQTYLENFSFRPTGVAAIIKKCRLPKSVQISVMATQVFLLI